MDFEFPLLFWEENKNSNRENLSNSCLIMKILRLQLWLRGRWTRSDLEGDSGGQTRLNSSGFDRFVRKFFFFFLSFFHYLSKHFIFPSTFLFLFFYFLLFPTTFFPIHFLTLNKALRSPLCWKLVSCFVVLAKILSWSIY